MAREKFEKRILTGAIKVACKFDDGTVRYWDTDKETVIQHIVYIVNEYRKQGYVLTLRQLHYQLVTQNWIVNHDTAYKKLSSILDDCRYGGIIDWDAIEDRGRIPWIPYSVNGIKHALEDTVDQYRLNRQEGQSNTVELWTEKDALSGIFKRVTSKYHIQLVVNKGYTSSSAAYNAYERIIGALKEGRRFTILYFGDHDPSGLDMIRDIRDRLILFLTKGNQTEVFRKSFEKWKDKFGYGPMDLYQTGYISEKTLDRLGDSEHNCFYDALDEYEAAFYKWYLESEKFFQIIPIGLTMQQIKKHKLPPNPTKLTDPRAVGYIKEFGRICWEVDALKPQTLTEIVEKNIQEQIDISIFDKVVKREKGQIAKLQILVDKYK